MEPKIDYLLKLKKERNAIILAHYYQDDVVQDIADFKGDSLALAQAAKEVKNDVIVFCGVHFMAETAKILNPDKIVLLPDLNAGCSLADSAPADKFKEWIDAHPNSVVVSYINCSTEVKAMSDLICTSSNAIKIIESIPKDKQILFAPDKYLGRYLIKQTGRQLILWNGSCQVHEQFSESKLIEIINANPDAEIIAHPECPENILDYADFIGSTTALINYTKTSNSDKFIILTEPGVIHEMKKYSPYKSFFTVPNLEGCNCNNCPYMKLNTIDKIIKCLENLEPQINIDEHLRIKALKPLEKMLEISKK
jgi:quinolinate synthase